MPAAIDLTGKRFGRLTVVSEAEPYFSPRGKPERRFLTQCDCGQKRIVLRSCLQNGSTRSCGCQRIDANAARATHGDARVGRKSVEYRTWASMIARCEIPTTKNFHRYGGRGIKVCDRWRESFENFLADMGRRPGAGLSIDRYPNKDGNYEKDNCRWATAKQQRANQ
jgi:hypothetical protein